MEIKEIFEKTWAFDEGGVRFFLLEGSEKALLIDSGMMTRDAKEQAEKLTSLPLMLINTHADMDHIGSNGEFETFYLNPGDAPAYALDNKAGILPAVDGDSLELGGRRVSVIALPGHTPGSIAILDENSGALFSGDPIQDGNIFMFGPGRDMHAYIESLKKLCEKKDSFKTIYPSHGSLTVEKDIIEKLIQGAEDVLAGKITPEKVDMFGNQVDLYKVGAAGFLYMT